MNSSAPSEIILGGRCSRSRPPFELFFYLAPQSESFSPFPIRKANQGNPLRYSYNPAHRSPSRSRQRRGACAAGAVPNQALCLWRRWRPSAACAERRRRLLAFLSRRPLGPVSHRAYSRAGSGSLGPEALSRLDSLSLIS